MINLENYLLKQIYIHNSNFNVTNDTLKQNFALALEFKYILFFY